jgi:hypothetical protein
LLFFHSLPFTFFPLCFFPLFVFISVFSPWCFKIQHHVVMLDKQEGLCFRSQYYESLPELVSGISAVIGLNPTLFPENGTLPHSELPAMSDAESAPPIPPRHGPASCNSSSSINSKVDTQSQKGSVDSLVVAVDAAEGAVAQPRSRSASESRGRASSSTTPPTVRRQTAIHVTEDAGGNGEDDPEQRERASSESSGKKLRRTSAISRRAAPPPTDAQQRREQQEPPDYDAELPPVPTTSKSSV